MGEEHAVDFAAIDRWLEEAYPQMERDLIGLLAFPSVKGAAEPGAPFGRPIAEALDYCLNMAQGLGLTVENIDGYVGLADMAGASEEQIGVLAHIDVVPASPADWQTPPFEPAVRDGRIYARGSEDDKGPLVAALYAALALEKSGVQLDKTVRFMFGCDEESGMSCMEYFLREHQPPSGGFSPDGSFPLVIGEKGLMQFDFTSSWRSEAGVAPLRLQSIHSGTVGNVVPDRAEAIFTVTDRFEIDGAALPGVSVKRMSDKLIVTAGGKAAHASTPEEGENALGKLLGFLAKQDFAPRGAKAFVTALARLFTDTCYGESLGVADEDDLSKLTIIPSILDVNESSGSLHCDMRFTLTRKAEYFRQKLQAIAATEGFNIVYGHVAEPLYAPEDSPLATALLEAYRGFTGDMAPPIIMGGGTYAKTMPNFVAFGPALPGVAHVAHQADEYVDCKEWLNSAKIYARAIYALAK